MKIKISLTVFFVAFNLVNSFCTSVESMLETTWKGRYESRTDLFQSGYLYMNYEMYNMDFDAYNSTLTGKFLSQVNISGTIYTSVCYISGNYDESMDQLTIRMTSIISEDQLPEGLEWTYNRLRLNLYMDADNNNYQILSGHSLDETGFYIGEAEFSNDPSY